MAKLEGESRRLARREAGIAEEGGPDGSEDALARAASVAQESVNESMTWVRAREPTKQYAQEGGKRLAALGGGRASKKGERRAGLGSRRLRPPHRPSHAPARRTRAPNLPRPQFLLV